MHIKKTLIIILLLAIAQPFHGMQQARDSRFLNALDGAKYTGNLKPFYELLDQGLSLDVRGGTYGATALMRAASYGMNEIVEKLLQRDANINLQDDRGYTALMFAASGGHQEIVEKLLRAGAKVDLTNEDGKTAVDLAMRYNHPAIAQYIESYSPGKTPEKITKQAAESSEKPTADITKLWKQLKQQLAFKRELKQKTAQKIKVQNTPQMPANFIPQTIIQLKTFFGQGKTEDEYINLAMEYPSGLDDSNYKIRLEHTRQLFVQLSKSVIENEKKYWNYDVFYHGQRGGLTLIYEIMNALYSWLNVDNSGEQTQVLRFFNSAATEYKNVDTFLNTIKIGSAAHTSKGLFDHMPIIKENILSTNLSLFGNIGFGGESTWYYFSNGWSNQPPAIKTQLSDFFKSFGFDQKFIDPILKIHQDYMSEMTETFGKVSAQPGVLFQIFIHPSTVDELCYLSGEGGIPLTTFTGQFLYQNYQQDLKALEQLQPFIFDTRLGRISVDKYLTLLKANSVQIPPKFINHAQARIYLKYSTLMDPEKVKIVIYETPTSKPEQAKKAQKTYKDKLEQIIEEIIKTWLFKEDKKTGEKTKLEVFFQFLKMQGNTH